MKSFIRYTIISMIIPAALLTAGIAASLASEPDDVKDFLSGDGAYNQSVVSVEIAAIKKHCF